MTGGGEATYRSKFFYISGDHISSNCCVCVCIYIFTFYCHFRCTAWHNFCKAGMCWLCIMFVLYLSPGMEGRSEFFNPKPHRQLSPLPESGYLSGSAIPSQPTQQPFRRSLHHTPDTKLPPAWSKQMYPRKLKCSLLDPLYWEVWCPE